MMLCGRIKATVCMGAMDLPVPSLRENKLDVTVALLVAYCMGYTPYQAPDKGTGFPGLSWGFSISSRHPRICTNYPGFQWHGLNDCVTLACASSAKRKKHVDSKFHWQSKWLKFRMAPSKKKKAGFKTGLAFIYITPFTKPPLNVLTTD